MNLFSHLGSWVAKPTRLIKSQWQTWSKKKKAVMSLIGAVLLTALIVGVIMVIKELTQPTESITGSISEQTAIKKDLEAIENNPPSPSASVTQRVAYLDKLSFHQAENGDYQGAIASFNERSSLQSNDLDQDDYVRLATYYHGLGDKNNALAAIDQALKVAPRQDDAETGYTFINFEQSMNVLKQEYGQ